MRMQMQNINILYYSEIWFEKYLIKCEKGPILTAVDYYYSIVFSASDGRTWSPAGWAPSSLIYHFQKGCKVSRFGFVWFLLWRCVANEKSDSHISKKRCHDKHCIPHTDSTWFSHFVAILKYGFALELWICRASVEDTSIVLRHCHHQPKPIRRHSFTCLYVCFHVWIQQLWFICAKHCGHPHRTAPKQFKLTCQNKSMGFWDGVCVVVSLCRCFVELIQTNFSGELH